jgi:3D (Asp-Asp-Asp) domain-containing protein
MKKMVILFLLGLGVMGLPRATTCVTMSIVTVTAYYPKVYRVGSPKGITASGERVQEGMIAVSRDVERNLNLNFGDRVLLHGLGVYDFQDRMARRCRSKVDIFMKCKKKARHFGVRRHVVLVKLA